MYRNCGKSVRFISFSDIDSFQNAWNGIGLYDEYYIDGESFTFNVKFQKWLKSNAGKTYADAVEAYKEIKKDKGGRKNIDSRFEYNTYIRDFFEHNAGHTLDGSIRCWKYKKSQPGSNRYEDSGLSSASE